MPGIVGLITQRPSDDWDATVRTMLATLDREEFYCSGIQSAPDIGVFAGWVAHKNSFAAAQPFRSRDGNIIILFSGEYFSESMSQGTGNTPDSGESAGSWMADLYQEVGAKMFERLNGMFSGLLIDRRERKAILFNDRYGTERIYWHETAEAFYFASEAKALLRVLPELREFDVNGVAQFLDFGCTLQCRTLFRGVQRMPEASAWSFNRSKNQKSTYFSSEIWESQSKLTAAEFVEELEFIFEKVLPRYFVADSKPGISLTGGLDSRLIMACLPETALKPISYTFSGAGEDVLDARVAARVAKARDLEHRIVRLGSDFFSDFRCFADSTVFVSDGTLGVSGAHEIYLNRKARLLSPIRITGVFGGEVMRGVSFFKPIGLATRLLSDDVQASVGPIENGGEGGARDSVSFAAFKEIPQRRFGTPAVARSQLVFRTPYLDNEFVALAFRKPANVQPNTDFIETVIGRKCPACVRIPTDRGRLGQSGRFAHLLRRTTAEVTFKLDYYYSEGLPSSVSAFSPFFRKAVRGMGVAGLHKFLTYRNWFKHELAKYVQEELADAREQQNGLWNNTLLRSLEQEHRLGRNCDATLINAILTISAVDRLLLRAESFSLNSANGEPCPQLSTAGGRTG